MTQIECLGINIDEAELSHLDYEMSQQKVKNDPPEEVDCQFIGNCPLDFKNCIGAGLKKAGITMEPGPAEDQYCGFIVARKDISAEDFLVPPLYNAKFVCGLFDD